MGGLTAERLYAHHTAALFEERARWSSERQRYEVDGSVPKCWAFLGASEKKVYRNLARRVTSRRAA